MQIVSRRIENKIGHAILLVKLTDLESKVNITRFCQCILFTSSQNLRIYKENSQAHAAKQTKYVDLVSDCSFSVWALVLVTLDKKKKKLSQDWH